MTHSYIRMEEPIVVTYENTDDNENAAYFFHTLETQGWKYIRVGQGEIWNGFMTRVRAYLKICNELPDNKIVVFSDARDVVCIRPPKAFLDAFMHMNADIVCSAEVFCDSKHIVDPTYIGKQCVSLHNYFTVRGIFPSIRKFVNAGLMAGVVKRFRHLFQWILDQHTQDDQLCLGMYMNLFPAHVCLDHDALLLHTSTFGVQGGNYAVHLQKHDSPTFAELFGCSAFFLHIPGLHLPGQKRMYECVKYHLKQYSSNEFLALYNIKTPGWDDYGDLKSHVNK